MKPTLIHLDPAQVSELDDLGETLDVSRSELVRRAISEMLSRLDRPGSDASAYDRIPLDAPDEWGNLADWLDAARAARKQ